MTVRIFAAVAIGLVILVLVMVARDPGTKPTPGPHLAFSWRVTDAQGAPLEGVKVHASIAEDSGIRESKEPKTRDVHLTSDAEGRFAFAGPTSMVDLCLKKAGFAPLSHSFMHPGPEATRLTVCMVRASALPKRDDLDKLGVRLPPTFEAAGKLGEKKGFSFDSGAYTSDDDPRADLVFTLKRDSFELSFPNSVGGMRQPCTEPLPDGWEKLAVEAPETGYASTLTEGLVDPFWTRGLLFAVKQGDRYVQAVVTVFWHGRQPPTDAAPTATYTLDVVYRMSRDRFFVPEPRVSYGGACN